MGRPFVSELNIINQTFEWAKNVKLDFKEEDLQDILANPTYVIGSGGSSSACYLFSLLQHNKGGFCKAITPLELYYNSSSIRNSNVVFISASGKNNDILLAYKNAIQKEAIRIFGLCMKQKTKLGSLANNHSISKIMELACPSGKDGFLATNSLIANFAILARMFKSTITFDELRISKPEISTLQKFVANLHDEFTITVLYAGWSQPVAIDIESKFTEAGLGNILFADYRNFGHGRHNWFDKKKKQSAVIALITPTEKILADKTLSLLPVNIPKLKLSTSHSEASAAIDLLYKSFHLVAEVGKKVGIDPGRPGVPSYGSKLYNLSYKSLLDDFSKNKNDEAAILRKAKLTNISSITKSEQTYWVSLLAEFRKKMSTYKFGSLIFDYDGTLCTRDEKRKVPRQTIVHELNTFLSKGLILGIVTGRGKSVRETLQKCLDSKYWDRVIIGYYNGAEISSLKNDLAPRVSGETDPELKTIASKLNNLKYSGSAPTITLRPFQISIEPNDPTRWLYVKQRVIESVKALSNHDPVVVESGHSIDILSSTEISKLNIVSVCISECKARNLETGYVCIGDKGSYPGNDFALLTSPHSLSVDEVSADPATCWNLAEPGSTGVLASLKYLQSIKYNKSFFTLSI